MIKKEVLENLKRSVECWDVELARSSAREALDLGISPSEAIEAGLSKGMTSISQRFDEAVIFLPQLLAASNAMEEAMKILDPVMGANSVAGKGTVVLGTVLGDVHEIGKNVIGAMLRGAGYRVIDLGRDVAIKRFVDECKKSDADMVGASALMTTTLWGQRAIAEGIRDEGLRTSTIFGGAPCNHRWVDSFGGDVYCPNGAEVVEMVERLMVKVRFEKAIQTESDPDGKHHKRVKDWNANEMNGMTCGIDS
ncbi:MAG TPA: cobalamin-dependent protein [Methanomassiliicoccales archaeon]|jgi:corrinoid protein of di/trimethylamine methyltransferase